MWNETLFLEMGSTHLHHDSALDHAKSNAHEASFQIYLRAEGCDVSECSEQRLAELQQNNQCTLSPRIQVHALIYETAHFSSDQVVSYISACAKLFGCMCMYQYTKHLYVKLSSNFEI